MAPPPASPTPTKVRPQTSFEQAHVLSKGDGATFWVDGSAYPYTVVGWNSSRRELHVQRDEWVVHPNGSITYLKRPNGPILTITYRKGTRRYQTKGVPSSSAGVWDLTRRWLRPRV
jgi:hypothetical protein